MKYLFLVLSITVLIAAGCDSEQTTANLIESQSNLNDNLNTPKTPEPKPKDEVFPFTPPKDIPKKNNCDPNYSGCVPIASDVDCAGGSGNGPAYTGRVSVTGSDIYDLDRDHDGIACE